MIKNGTTALMHNHCYYWNLAFQKETDTVIEPECNDTIINVDAYIRVTYPT